MRSLIILSIALSATVNAQRGGGGRGGKGGNNTCTGSSCGGGGGRGNNTNGTGTGGWGGYGGRGNNTNGTGTGGWGGGRGNNTNGTGTGGWGGWGGRGNNTNVTAADCEYTKWKSVGSCRANSTGVGQQRQMRRVTLKGRSGLFNPMVKRICESAVQTIPCNVSGPRPPRNGSNTGNSTSPRNCIPGMWRRSSNCSAECTMTWTRSVIRDASNGGKPCPDLVRNTSCRSGACIGSTSGSKVDCELGDWTNGTCGPKCYRIDRRSIIKAPSRGGKRCGSIIRRSTCDTCDPNNNNNTKPARPTTWSGNLRLTLNLNKTKELVVNLLDKAASGAHKNATVIAVDGQAVTAANSTIKGEYGFLTINGAGQAVYKPSLSDPVVPAILRFARRLTDTFEVEVQNAAGKKAATHVSITIYKPRS